MSAAGGGMDFGSEDPLVNFNAGGPVVAGQTIGNFIAGHSVFLIYGDATGTTSVNVYIPNPTVNQIDVKSIFSTDNLHYQVNGPTITAQFTPTISIAGVPIPMAVSDVEKLYGVDHFNWIQKVTLPPGWSAQIKTGTQTFPTQQPLIDPIVTPLAQYQLTNPAANPLANPFLITNKTTPDTLPYYFDETKNGAIDDVRAWNQGTQVSFQDDPGLGLQNNPDRENLVFQTELVGVTVDDMGNVTGEKDTHLGFTWESNYVTDPFVGGIGGVQFGGYLSNLDPSDLPPTLGGGISNVQVFGVPEPSSFVLSILAMFGVLAVSRKKTQRRLHVGAKVVLVVLVTLLARSGLLAQDNTAKPHTEDLSKVYLIDMQNRKATEVEKDKEGNLKLLPDRIYKRYEPVTKRWVYDKTGWQTRPHPHFSVTPKYLLPFSEIPGDWLGVSRDTIFVYLGPPSTGWDSWNVIKKSDATGRYMFWQFTDPPGEVVNYYEVNR